MNRIADRGGAGWPRAFLSSRPARRAQALATGFATALTLALAVPGVAGAHAVLERTEPERGAQLDASPGEVGFFFNEPVEASFGAVRVYDRDGERVDDGELVRPERRGDAAGVGLSADLPGGLYTATYRVISADSHPVSGGFTFTIGDPGQGTAVGVGELVDEAGSGPVTDVALGAARVATHVATALVVGGLAFLVLVWGPALRGVAGASQRWRSASDSFGRALRQLIVAALVTGAIATAIGILLQGAIGLGDSLWRALRPEVVSDVLGTRFGTVWGLRLLDWGLVAVLVLVPALGMRFATLAPARLGATGAAPVGPLPRRGLAGLALAAALGFLVLAPGLAGHAGTVEPVWVLLPANFLHVLGFAVWAGGLAALVVVVPRATTELEGGEKTALLAAVVARFSLFALISVAVLLATGIVQSLLETGIVESPLEPDAWADLIETGYGRAILAKVALLAALIGLGAYNRRRLGPRLNSRASLGETPGVPGVALRRTVRAEVGLIAAVLVATAFLAALAPSGVLNEGPFSDSADLGPARLDVTVDPARAGGNEVHLYLFDRSDGSQWDEPKDVEVAATLPDEEIGPLDQEVRRAGPGHYVVPAAELGVVGDWELEVMARISDFDEHRTTLEVPIE